ncbi:MAG: exodeoxyribonuclease V subunit gamma [Kiritimatiellia bacterium]
MSFHLHQGNSLEVLAIQLATLLKANPATAGAPDPFAQETVVVPNQGLARWLCLKIAETNDLCPAIDFPYPGAFLYRYVFNPMAEVAVPVSAEEADLPFAPATVQWHLLKLLAELEAEPAFENVRNFVANDAFRRYQLAERLAQLYDRYMTYRPDLLYAWETNSNPISGEDANWQSQLWRSLIKANAGQTPHFSGLYQQFISATARQAKHPEFLTPLLQKRRVFYFGVAPLPPAHLDILIRVASLPGFDLHFFAVNPCQEEWSDAASLKTQLRDKATLVQSVGESLAQNYAAPANPLLGSMGKSGREFFSLLIAYDNVIEEASSFVPPPASDTSILATLQRDVINNLPPQRKLKFEKSDGSITIHACHSRMREVEVLHDQLLALFQELTDLAPREISVYTPEIESYAPYIDAVFGQTQPGDAGHIPYNIADKSLLHEYAECKAFLALLNTATSRFKASDLLGLLQNAVIRNCFDLTEDDVASLGTLLKKANLAWGVDAAFREKQGASKVYANTWQFALDRLILGAAMWDTADTADPLIVDSNACIPCHAADDNALALGCLASFFTAMKELHVICTEASSRSAANWHVELSQVLARFFTQDEEAPYGVILMRQTLDQFKRYIDNAGCMNLALPFATVLDWIKKQLNGAPGSERFVTGRVTFSRFQPMRNVPMRVVGMLGMNDGAFPRNTPYLSFDLMESHTSRKVGDSLTRDADRYAFLETLLAARKRIIITYIGQSETDNKPLPPSVLVSELIDTIAASALFPEDISTAQALTANHPLHPFSPEYFKAEKQDPRLISFSESYYQVAKELVRGTTEASTKVESSSAEHLPATMEEPLKAAERVVTLETLINFFKSPCKYFYTSRLGVHLDIRSADLPDGEEPLEPDALLKYALQSELLETMSDSAESDDEQRVRARWEAEGRVAPGSQKIIENIAITIRELLQNKDELDLGEAQDTAYISVALGNAILLQGTLNTVYANNAMLFLRPAKEKGKDIVDAGLTHLAACASGLQLTTYGIYSDKTITYKPVEQKQATHTLNRLVDYFKDEAHHPLCFAPAIGWKIVSAGEDKVSDSDWRGNDYNFGVDIYMRRAFGETLPESGTPEWRSLKEIATTLFEPLEHSRDDGAKKKGATK